MMLPLFLCLISIFLFFLGLMVGADSKDKVCTQLSKIRALLVITGTMIALIGVDYAARQTKINIIAPISEKKFVTPGKNQPIYAFVVSYKRNAWVYSVPKQTFNAYNTGEMVRLKQRRGLISGFTYSTTLYQ